jgi:hypothetical protein
MKRPLPIAIAIITGLVTITGSYFTATATSDSRVSEIDTKVQLLEKTQSLQYAELKSNIDDLKKGQDKTIDKLEQIFKAVK